jgi:hypothetical protein
MDFTKDGTWKDEHGKILLPKKEVSKAISLEVLYSEVFDDFYKEALEGIKKGKTTDELLDSRTNRNGEKFVSLIKDLENELKEKYGEPNAFIIMEYAKYRVLQSRNELDFSGFLDDFKLVDTVKFPEQRVFDFAVIKPARAAVVKKDFARYLGATDKIRELYPNLLKVKTFGGKTLAERLDDIDNWYNNLHGEDLAKWIKFFMFVQAVKDHKDAPEYVGDMRETSPGSGIFQFYIKTDQRFYESFIEKPNAKHQDGRVYYSTKKKEQVDNWLKANSQAVSFPDIIHDAQGDAHIAINAYPIYTLNLEMVNPKTQKPEILLTVNTNILDGYFNDYAVFTRDEIDKVKEAWHKTADMNQNFKKYRLETEFQDLPLRFLTVLKTIYNSKMDKTITGKDGKPYLINTQHLSIDNFIKRMGQLDQRILKHLTSTDRGGIKGEAPGIISNTLLEATFKVAIELKWIKNSPKSHGNSFVFNINPGHFAKQKTAEALQELIKQEC